MKNAFGVEVDQAGSSSSTQTALPGRNLEQDRRLSAHLQTLRAQATAALADDARVKAEVEQARRVLQRTAETASNALARLAQTEAQLEEKWALLVALLADVRQLEHERHEALKLAEQLSSLEAEEELLAMESGDDLEDEADEDREHQSDVTVSSTSLGPDAGADLRAAFKQVVSALPTTRASQR